MNLNFTVMTAKKKASEDAQHEEEKVVAQIAETSTEVAIDTTGTSELEGVKPQDHTTVVIPYCKEFAQGKELLFAVRSWYGNARFPANLVIVGDREDWFDDEVTVIDHQRTSDNPQIDTLEKLKLAIESTEVTERFIWTNDDIYLINRISLAHIELPKVLGALEPDNFNGTYAENLRRTVALLDKAGLPKLNYSTHTPVLFEKSKLKEMLNRFPEAESGVLFSSLYFNSQPSPTHPVVLSWQTDQFLLPVVSKNPNEKLAKELMMKKVFLNNAVSGYSPWLEGLLERMFPEPCIFEN